MMKSIHSAKWMSLQYSSPDDDDDDDCAASIRILECDDVLWIIHTGSMEKPTQIMLVRK